jgi:hypothetical protein
MTRLLLVIGCVLLAGLPVCAQSQKWDAFGGRHFTNFKLSYATQKVSGNGWDAALSYKINDWAAAKVDVSGSYSRGVTLDNTTFNSGPVNLHTYTFGPVFSVPDERAKRLWESSSVDTPNIISSWVRLFRVRLSWEVAAPMWKPQNTLPGVLKWIGLD